MGLAAQPHLLQDVQRLFGDATRSELLLPARREHQRNAQVVEHRHADKRFWDLKTASQAQPRAAVRRFVAEVMALETYPALFVAQCPRDAVDQRGLARAIGPDQAEALTRPHD